MKTTALGLSFVGKVVTEDWEKKESMALIFL